MACARLKIKRDKGKASGFEFAGGMRYTAAEDAFQRRYNFYSALEEDLKKDSKYIIEGRSFNIKEIENLLEGNQFTLAADEDLQY